MEKINEEILKKEIGRRVHELRTRREESMDAFGRLIGTNSAMISNIENGKSIPGGAILFNMSNACNVSIDWILKGVEPEQEGLRESAGRHIFFRDKWQFFCRCENGYLSEADRKTLDAVFSLLGNVNNLKSDDIDLLSAVAARIIKDRE